MYRVKCRYFGRWARVFQADKTLKQVQGDESARAVIPNLIRNRKVEVDKLKSCCRKRDFSVLATLKQVQSDEKGRAVIPNSFRNRKVEVDKLKTYRRKRNFHVLATLKQVQGDEKACFHYKSNSK